MAQQLIDAIAWDWGRVLGTFSNEKMWDALAVYSTGGTADNIKKLIVPISKLHETGKISSAEFYKRAVKAAPLEISYAQFFDAWRSCITGENPGMADLLRRIRPEIRQGVLSNTDPIHWTAIEVLPLMKEFFPRPEQLVRSYDANVQMLKPGENMYFEVRKRLKILSNEPHRLLYFDDIVEYCTAGATLGFRTQHYNCLTDPIGRIEKALDSLGALQ